MMAKLRMFSMEWAVMGRGIAGRSRQGNGIALIGLGETLCLKGRIIA
jgi:hypothetical protein